MLGSAADGEVEPGGKPEVRWVVNVLLPDIGDA
jgi:hypothetical protein